MSEETVEERKKLVSMIAIFLFDILPLQDQELFKDSNLYIADVSISQRKRRFRENTNISDKSWDETFEAIGQSIDKLLCINNDIENILACIIKDVIAAVPFFHLESVKSIIDSEEMFKKYSYFLAVIISYHFLKGQQKGLKDFLLPNCWYLQSDGKTAIQIVFDRFFRIAGQKTYSAAKKVLKDSIDTEKRENLKRKMQRWINGDSSPANFIEIKQIVDGLSSDIEWFDSVDIWLARFKLAWTMDNLFKKINSIPFGKSKIINDDIFSIMQEMSKDIDFYKGLGNFDYYAWFLMRKDMETKRTSKKYKMKLDTEEFDLPVNKTLILLNCNNIFSEKEIKNYFNQNLIHQAWFEIENQDKLKHITIIRFTKFMNAIV